jgi:hypothetical protein
MNQWHQMLMVVALAVVGGGGCATPSIEYTKGSVPLVLRAPANGVWELYPRHARKPVFDAVLLKHDHIGFEEDDRGKLLAVAAGQMHPLADGSYCWRFEGYGGRENKLPGGEKDNDHTDWRAMVIEALGEAVGDMVTGAVSRELDRVTNWGDNQRARELRREERADHSRN